MAKRVVVIGGGCSGLVATKCCLDEGLEPVCFERTDEIGGLWLYTENVRKGQGCVMRSTVINTSKEMMCFSDYPIPKHYPNFMHNTQVWQYFKEYAEHFKLYDHIQYNTEVVLVKRAPDFSKTGKWEVHIRNHKTGEERTEIFDAVLVCTGHHAEKNEPSFPGLSDFQGRVVHSHDYREPSSYVGKRILIIGIGNSGGDLAVELSRCGQVYLSTRRGAWVFIRLDKGGLPWDIGFSSRSALLFNKILPKSVSLGLLKWKLNRLLDHDRYGLTPTYPPLAQHPTVNDELGNRIANGTIIVKADVKRFTATGVEFIDGTFEDNIDEVVLATGYIFGFPYIEKQVVDIKENRAPFYKYMFPPDLEHKTLAIIGCIQPLGAIMPIAELQCRLATRVFKGEVKLPSTSEMWEDVPAKETAMAQRYWKSSRHTIQVDWIPFMDELAELVGCKPNILALARSDPVLAWHMFFGPCTPYQYRLVGPGKWAGARDAILTTMDRVLYPMGTRPLAPEVKAAKNQQKYLVWILLAIVAVIILRLLLA